MIVSESLTVLHDAVRLDGVMWNILWDSFLKFPSTVFQIHLIPRCSSLSTVSIEAHVYTLIESWALIAHNADNL